ncbi:EcoKI restriction-modification system protein HsdS [Haemophilus influenzae]|uniref:restriction endonuclease subunit S n=1 Tax=Haemophilus influenzae TaxID=727 RepID=UPI000CFEBF42|nr:restriction endonuclease subunit S [Haemophilus influenzae]MCK9005389.1 restriction endonuclease subunit S [Haemophilus influenzae]PRI66050.1 EcoKI restriction-modification system protein HsdS [Haemophilus influenzae]
MRRYESYKDSGVEWLGEVPSHWELKRLKQLFVEKKHKQNLSLNCGAISFGKVIEKADDKVTEATKRSYQEVLKGEFLINPLNLNYDLISLRIALSEIDVVVSAGYIVLKEKQIINKKYFSYLLHRYDVAYMKLLGSGVRQTINYGHISDSILVIPPLSEQQKIAQFLDDKTAKIDQAVDLAEKQIALLKEHKQILIQNAVTRGLNPDVPLKDSGVEWIGQVPEHWELTIGMNVFRENKRDNKGMKENTVLSLSYGKIIIKPEEKLFGLVPESFETYQIVEPNDIIIRCTDLQNDQTSLRTGLAQDKGIITSAYLNLKVINNYSAKFLHYYLHALDITKVLYKFGSGLRQNLSFLDFKRLPIIDISLAEQQIADYLDKQTSKIDQAIALKTAHIEKLKEYKSVLINDVVTGKVRV